MTALAPRGPRSLCAPPPRPITLSPSNAPSRAVIGPASTPPAPYWPGWRPGPRPGSEQPAAWSPEASSCMGRSPVTPAHPRPTAPHSDPSVAQVHPAPKNRPRGARAHAAADTRVDRARDGSGAPGGCGPWGRGRKSGGGGPDACPRPPGGSPLVPKDPPQLAPVRARPRAGSRRRRARGSPHSPRCAGPWGAAPTLIGLGGAAKLSAHVAWPPGDGRSLNSVGAELEGAREKGAAASAPPASALHPSLRAAAERSPPAPAAPAAPQVRAVGPREGRAPGGAGDGAAPGAGETTRLSGWGRGLRTTRLGTELGLGAHEAGRAGVLHEVGGPGPAEW
ncbi:PREDICTED: spidroin-2-like [Elephantulus edwardii]|uniref:spidroin-2-like n=1 Tax=Elephantulus edwardii TaxID=28737 RepID=UPI0003F0D916|nr:PREDICTED: spidroin-2-like [Elephantulus edwardii]